MDEMFTKSKPAPITSVDTLVDSTGLHHHLTHRRSTRVLMIILGTVLVVLAVVIVWREFFHKKTSVQLTPTQTLQALKATSQPVTSTPDARAVSLTKVSNDSIQRPVTQTQQIDMLKALEK